MDYLVIAFFVLFIPVVTLPVLQTDGTGKNELQVGDLTDYVLIVMLRINTIERKES